MQVQFVKPKILSWLHMCCNINLSKKTTSSKKRIKFISLSNFHTHHMDSPRYGMVWLRNLEGHRTSACPGKKDPKTTLRRWKPWRPLYPHHVRKRWGRSVRVVNHPRKTNMTGPLAGKSTCPIGNTSSNDGFSSVMLVFGGRKCS